MKILKAILGAGMTLLFFFVLPKLALEKAQPELFASVGLEPGILNILTNLGLAMTFLYLIKTLTSKANPANLVSSVSLELARFYFFLFSISFGDPASLGRVEKTVTTAGTGITITFDFQFFALLLFAVLAFKVVVALLEFYQARKKPDAKSTQ